MLNHKIFNLIQTKKTNENQQIPEIEETSSNKITFRKKYEKNKLKNTNTS